MLPNMKNDWRFQQSPHVREGGLCSYAGAQLRCKAPSGQDVAFGSLCVASMSERPPLDTSQQAALSRFADMVAADIISHSRQTRRHDRDVMAESIARSYNVSPDNVERFTFNIIRRTYPQATVSIQEADNGSITLPDHPPLPLTDIKDGLWEDTSLIEGLIRTENHKALETPQAVRAIVHLCQRHPVTTYLVVASNQVQHVFDDYDSWFVERCAQRIKESAQDSRLNEALEAKERFLRGITHQLRTPIHGVLGSCELLGEELASRNQLVGATGSSSLSPAVVLNTIKDSGRELMSTVNNMLKLIRWAESGATSEPARLSCFNQIETDIMYEVNQNIPDSELTNISILFENQLSGNDSMVVIDLQLLKECLQALILNALLYTQQGAVIVVISAPADYSRLTFDVRDTGCGIAPEDQSRIFEAYEKVSAFSRGIGLGLTLASKIVGVMNGSLTLVHSSQDADRHGSQFRAEFYNPGFACPRERLPNLEETLHAVPRSFHVIPASSERPDLVRHFASFLRHRGFQDADTPEGSMIVLTYTSDEEEFRKLVASVDRRQVAMCLIPAGASPMDTHGEHEVRFYSGPFLTTRLEEMIKELDVIYERLNADNLLGETATGYASGTDAHRTSGTPGDISPAKCDPTALLADDNAVNLRIMRMFCEKRQIPYVTAADGKEAVEQFKASLEKNQPVNLVLMDLQMPNCDGVDATREIRRLEAESELPPSCIFMVTGQDSPVDKTRSFAAGANEFYVKPMSIKTMDRGIGEYFPNLAHKVKMKGMGR